MLSTKIKKLAQPTWWFLTLKISRKSCSGLLQLVFHFGTENWEEELKNTLHKTFEHCQYFQNVFCLSLRGEERINLLMSRRNKTRIWLARLHRNKSRLMFCFWFNFSNFKETESDNHISCCSPDFIFLMSTNTARRTNAVYSSVD